MVVNLILTPCNYANYGYFIFVLTATYELRVSRKATYVTTLVCIWPVKLP
jgi:hypothetical protein